MSERHWTSAVDGVLLQHFDESFDIERPTHRPDTLQISRVNLLVGPNNAGKSRFLRVMAKEEKPRIRVGDGQWSNDPRKSIKEALSHWKWIVDRVENASLQYPELSRERSHFSEWVQKARSIQGRLSEASANSWLSFEGNSNPTVIKDARQHRTALNQLQDLSERMRSEDVSKRELDAFDATLASAESATSPWLPPPVYIPVLRGLRAVARQGSSRKYDDAYHAATVHDYGFRQQFVIETGLTLYDDLRKQLLGKREQRDGVRAYEEFLSKIFFEGRRLTITPHEEEQALHIDLDGKEHPIHHVGDGLQSVIVLTYRAYITRSTPGLFFIEEPELFLHPGMQRRLLSFFLHETPHLYFITTHSNHLLDLSMDERGITVYNFHRAPKAGATDSNDSSMVTRVCRVNGGDQSSLALLGVRVSSVFLVNATVWVEGITDRLYLREMLRLYVASKSGDKAFRRMEEDTHYSFVEYGGSNIVHWSFLQDEEHPIEVKRLCAHGILMMDADDSATPGTKKHKRRTDLANTLADRLLVTSGREVENMLPERVVRAVLKRYNEADALVNTVTRSAYRDEPLGRWLDTHLGSTKARKGGYGDDSGTVTRKPEFCDRAIDAMREAGFTFADLPDEVQDLVVRVYRFILEQNR